MKIAEYDSVARDFPPLHTKLSRLEQAKQSILDFLQWAEKEKGLVLCEPYKPQYDWYSPSAVGKEKLALEFFNIDLKELEAERRALSPAAAVAPQNSR